MCNILTDPTVKESTHTYVYIHTYHKLMNSYVLQLQLSKQPYCQILYTGNWP